VRDGLDRHDEPGVRLPFGGIEAIIDEVSDAMTEAVRPVPSVEG
jgi:hypothetical protein